MCENCSLYFTIFQLKDQFIDRNLLNEFKSEFKKKSSCKILLFSINRKSIIEKNLSNKLGNYEILAKFIFFEIPFKNIPVRNFGW